MGLSLTALYLDERLLEETLTGYPWVFTGSPEAARQILSTIASSIMTVAALAFSMTMVALTLASSQFGPRILRNFIKDTGNQVVLGTFLATYIYCLNVLRSVKGMEDNSFVPQISISLAIVFLLASIGVLIYFIHHMVTSIQANYIVADISKELQRIIRRLYPERDTINRLPEHTSLPRFEVEQLENGQIPVRAHQDGYLQTIDYDALLKVAVDFNLRFYISLRPGAYVIQEHPLLTIPFQVAKMEELACRVNEAFILGPRQTPTQDVEFSIDQLVEIAIRALSPGINDPFTAMTCIDHLGNALALLFRRPEPSPYHFDQKGQLRIMTRNITTPGVIDAAFNQIRQYGRTSVPVMIRLLETISRIALDAHTEEIRDALYKQAVIIEHSGQEAFPEEFDRAALKKRFDAVQRALAVSSRVYPSESSPLPRPAMEAR